MCQILETLTTFFINKTRASGKGRRLKVTEITYQIRRTRAASLHRVAMAAFPTFTFTDAPVQGNKKYLAIDIGAADSTYRDNNTLCK